MQTRRKHRPIPGAGGWTIVPLFLALFLSSAALLRAQSADPLHQLSNSVTMGVVSAVARQLDPDSAMVFIQTDASINPGNSGGPLVNIEGELVGINTSMISQSGGNEGLGFAIPSAVVGFAYPQLRKYG